MERIRQLERKLIAAEGMLCVALVLLMLVLAGYNVVYRNVLVPLQTRWAHSGPPASQSVVEPQPRQKAEEPRPAARGREEAGGFGGAFGKESGADELEDEDAGGFGGGFGDGAPEGAGGFGGAFGDGASDEDPESEDEESGGFGGAFGSPDSDEEGHDEEDGGFGGAFGKTPPAKSDETSEKEEDEFFVEDEFANLPEISAAGSDPVAEEPQGGPPPEGSFAAWAVSAIDAIKLDWIDVFARQLVIIVSFLGAAIATQRNKHINIDALSKLLQPRAQRMVAILTHALAVGVCLVLANAGSRLVAIGRQYPRELVPFAEQWVFQLMFPLGFGLLAFHFGVRLVEGVTGQDAGTASAAERARANEEDGSPDSGEQNEEDGSSKSDHSDAGEDER